jgi:RimJ/RimL family protein N-acetyltransferase
MRSIERTDIEKLRLWRNRNEIRKNFFNKARISAVLQQKWFEGYKKRMDDIMFIFETHGGENIGTVSIYNIDKKNRSGEYGRLIIGDKKFLRKGFALEATREILRFGFKSLGLHRIYLQVFEENIQARKLYEEAGFQNEGLLRDAFLEKGKDYRNIIQMSILEEVFKNGREHI